MKRNVCLQARRRNINSPRAQQILHSCYWKECPRRTRARIDIPSIAASSKNPWPDRLLLSPWIAAGAHHQETTTAFHHRNNNNTAAQRVNAPLPPPPQGLPQRPPRAGRVRRPQDFHPPALRRAGFQQPGGMPPGFGSAWGQPSRRRALGWALLGSTAAGTGPGTTGL